MSNRSSTKGPNAGMANTFSSDVAPRTPLRAAISKILRSTTALTASMLAISSVASTQALAQAAAPADAPLDEIVVSGSRIVRNGYQAPTPVTVVTQEQLESTATITLADTVNRLPEFANSVTPAASTNSVSQGIAGLNNLNLRGLGSTRTLVLEDSQRLVGSSFNNVYANSGSVDVNVIPAGLVKRIDVVTGGASAAYGSDAVAGVVNFVLDHEFVGFKTNVEGGISGHRDDGSWKAEVTAGTPFADHGHFEVYGLYSGNQEVPATSRSSMAPGNELIPNLAYTATNGLPQYVGTQNVGNSTGAPGGVITGGPLKGVAFGPGGTPYQLQGTVDGPWLIGGNWQDTRTDNVPDLAAQVNLESVFSRASYDVAPDINVWLQWQWTYSHSFETAALPSAYLGNLTIASTNPFIPQSIRTAMANDNVTSLPFGLEDIGGNGIAPSNDRYFTRYSAGIDGKATMFGSDWIWGGSYEYSTNRIEEHAFNDPNSVNLRQALASVAGPNGAPVCSNPANGCVPYNPFGIGVNSQAALNFVTGTAYQLVLLTQKAAEVHISGNPFSLWAGPVSIASGVEWRSEAVGGNSDALDQASAFNFGNYLPSSGEYSVTEGFLETVVPLASKTFWAKSLDLNGAVRATDYSTSGYVTTWKVGLTYQPIDDLRFRVTRSRDIRAPNLAELFTSGSFALPTLTDPFHNNQQVVVTNPTQGNPNLQPEKADTTGAGIIFSPTFFPGFEASVDYFDININGAIATVGGQQYINLCFDGQTQYCQFITRNAAGTITSVENTGANIAVLKEHGLDIEASYRFAVNNLVKSWEGDFEFRFLGTKVFSFVTDSLGVITQGAGTMPGAGSAVGAPSFTANASASYSLNPVSTTLTARYISPSVISNSYIQCTSGCPASTPLNPTVNTNHVGSNLLFDFAANYKLLDGRMDMYLAVDNLLDRQPPLLIGTIGNGYLGLFNGVGYDRIGRYFRAGVRFKL
jgi:iron complex outermembrane receptor protein